MHSEACPTPGEIGRGVADVISRWHDSKKGLPWAPHEAAALEPPKGLGAEVPLKELPQDRAAPGLIPYNRAGFGTADAEEIARRTGLEFKEKLDARGQVHTEVNIKENAPTEGLQAPGAPLIFPTRVETDAVNPRALNASERVERGLTMKSLNMSTMLDLGVARSLRAVEAMVTPALEHDFPAINGRTSQEMARMTDQQVDRALGIANATDLTTYAGLQTGADVKAIRGAAARGRSWLILAAMQTKAVQERAIEIAKATEGKVKFSGAGASALEKAEFVEAMGQIGDFTAYAKIIKGELGRALWMQRLPIEKLPELPQRLSAAALRENPEMVEKIILAAGGHGTVEQMARNLAALGPNVDIKNLAATLSLASGSKGTRILAATKEGWMAGLMSSARTYTTNFGGNVFGALSLPIDRVIGAQVGMLAKHTPEEVAQLQRIRAVALGQFTDQAKTLSESLHFAKMAFKENRDIFNQRGSVFEVTPLANRQALAAKNFDINQSGLAAKSIDAVGAMTGFVLKSLRGADTGFKELTARSYGRSLLRQKYLADGVPLGQLEGKVEEGLNKLLIDGQIASVQALRDRFLKEARATGLDGIHAIEYGERKLAEYIQTPEWQEFSPIANKMKADALDATYQTPQRENSIGKWITDLTYQHPALGFVAPFVNTPLNLLKAAGQRVDVISLARWIKEINFPSDKITAQNVSPHYAAGLKFAESRMRLLRDLSSADLEVRTQAVGRITTGMTFSLAVGTMASTGMLTGRGPADPGERKALMDSGWLPYSIKLGDTYVSYARMDPIATIVGSIADLMMADAYLPEDQKGFAKNLASGVVVAASNNLVNKSYLQGIANFMELLTNGESTGGKKYLRSFASSFVPNAAKDAAGLVSDLAGEDGTMKDVRGVIDAMLAKTPGLSLNLEPIRNALGEPVKRTTQLGSSVTGGLTNLFVPIATAHRDDPVTKELAATGFGFQRPPSGRNGYDLVDIKNAKGRSAYDAWQENTSTVKLGGQSLRGALDQLIKSERYQRLSPYNTSDQPSPRINAIQTVIGRYRRAAFDKTQRDIPELNQAELSFRTNRATLRSGGLLIRQ